MTEVEYREVVQIFQSFYLGNEIIIKSQRSKSDKSIKSFNFSDRVIIEPQSHKIVILRDNFWDYLYKTFVLEIKLVIVFRSREKPLFLAKVFKSLYCHHWVRTRVQIDVFLLFTI